MGQVTCPPGWVVVGSPISHLSSRDAVLLNAGGGSWGEDEQGIHDEDRPGWSDGSGLPELINVSVTKVGIQPPTAKFDWLKKINKSIFKTVIFCFQVSP